jgi:hypothetical protein
LFWIPDGPELFAGVDDFRRKTRNHPGFRPEGRWYESSSPITPHWIQLASMTISAIDVGQKNEAINKLEDVREAGASMSIARPASADLHRDHAHRGVDCLNLYPRRSA